MKCKLHDLVCAGLILEWRTYVLLLAKSTTTPVGFEPTRGDPIGLAGRRLNRSAKVSLPKGIEDHICGVLFVFLAFPASTAFLASAAFEHSWHSWNPGHPWHSQHSLHSGCPQHS